MSEPLPASGERKPGENKGSDDPWLIDDSAAIVEDMDALISDRDLSDVTFVVEGERIHAHRVILAARCEYFRAMLYDGLKDSSEAEIQLEGTNALAFRTLLRYIYTGRVEVSAFEVEELLAILRLAHEYRVVTIQRPIVDHLKKNLDINNVFTILRTSTLLFNDLTESCMQIVDQNASKVLASRNFLTLHQKAIVDILSRDSFYAPEKDIFKAICQWIRAQPSTEGITTEELVASFISKKCLRLDLIHSEDLLELFEAKCPALEQFIVDALDRRYQDTVSDMRGYVVLNTNVATVELGAAVVEGENRDMLLRAAQGNRDNRNTSLTRHKIGHDEGIIVQLGRPYTINSIRVGIGDCDVDTICSFKIEVSMDCHNWERPCSSARCKCFPVHELIFDARLVRYIRVVGTYNSKNNEYFSLALFEAYCSTRSVEFDNCPEFAQQHCTTQLCSKE